MKADFSTLNFIRSTRLELSTSLS